MCQDTVEQQIVELQENKLAKMELPEIEEDMSERDFGCLNLADLKKLFLLDNKSEM